MFVQKHFQDIFNDGYDVNRILKNISLKDTSLQFIPGKTIFFFDEIQACSNVATALKSFKMDGRFDVICSGSLMGINYQEIESNSVGYKMDYEMNSLDFEEFLWAKGYHKNQLEDLYQHMLNLTPLSALEMDVFFDAFGEYLVLGGMPIVLSLFLTNNNYAGTLERQRQILRDYEEDITKYAQGHAQGRILNVYHKIPVFLAKDNKKFQISKVAHGSRNREYVGTIDWLERAGIINPCYCMSTLELPLKRNYNPDNYKVYFRDTGLLVASLDEQAQEDLRYNKNFNTYKGALYENIVGDMFYKQGYPLYFYRDKYGTLEMDFFVRDQHTLIPVEVKAKDGATPSLNRLIDDPLYPEIHYGIKLCRKNIGFNGKFYTFPYFLTPFIKRFLKEKD